MINVNGPGNAYKDLYKEANSTDESESLDESGVDPAPDEFENIGIG